MATNAGQGNSAIAGIEEAKAAGKATKKPKPRTPKLPSGPLTPYHLRDAISPPAIPKTPKDNGNNQSDRLRDPWEFSEPSSFSPWYYATTLDPYIKELLKGATEILNFFPNRTQPSEIVRTVKSDKMAAPQLIFVDGTFAELAQEMADYLQVGDQVKPYLAKEQNEEALQIIVKASHALNSVPETTFTAASNLLIHLVLQSTDPKKYLPTVCGNLQKPITSSPAHGTTLAATALGAIFNLLKPANPLRYNVFLQIVRFTRQHGQFDVLKTHLKNLEGWFATWETDEEDQRRLYSEVSDAAAEAGDDE